jgi:hypothetical protein
LALVFAAFAAPAIVARLAPLPHLPMPRSKRARDSTPAGLERSTGCSLPRSPSA